MLPSSDRPVRIMLAFLVLLVFQLQAFAQQQLELPSIDKHVEILADDRGVPVVRAQTYDDAVAALGFLHGRDRFFQMDAMRRLGSGRLAELLGSSQIGRDEEIRRQQVGEAARTALDLLQPDNRAALRRYVAGVNAGLASLPVLPPEYLILGSRPEPWTELDAMHVTVALMRMLSDMQDREQIETEIFSSLDPQIVALLDPARTSLDAEIPVQADWWLDERLQSSLPALPGPDVVDFRDDDTPRKELYRVLGRRAPLDDWPEREDEPPAGSNMWGVSGAHTRHGGALIAGDMHLGLTLPATWYHAQIEIGSGGWTDGDEDKTGLRGYVGLTIPGGWPLFVGGSTGSLAFAFTNLHGDLADLVVVETDPNDPSRYLTPEGSEPFGIVTESIAVRNEETRTLDVRTTRWGPIVAIDADGRPLALRWIVQDPLALVGDGADLARELSAVRTVAEAVRVVSRAGGPPLNVVVADAHGDVAYAVMGALPTRRDGRMSKDWRDARTEWPISLDAKPEPIVAPASGVVFNANNRSLSLDAWSAVGRQPGAPSRAFRIRELLAEHLAGPASDVDERAMLEMQFDAHAYRYSYLAAHFSAALQDASDPDLRALGGMFADWDGKASANSRVYPIAYEISRVLEADLIGRLALPALEARQAKSSESADADEPGPWWFRVPVRSRDTVRAALAERPDHLLPAGFDEWDDYLRDVAAYAIAGMGGAEVAARTGRTWGERNKLAVRHPLSDALPSSFAWLKDRLSLPEVQQAGAGGTIHVTGRTFGASNRLVVSPGREEFGVLQLPGGRSGIPMSRLSQNRFEAWATGEPDPLLARDPQLEWLLNPSDRE